MASGREPLPARYLAWVAAAVVSRTGDAAMYFALGWAASAYGAAAAGLVITMVVVPRTVLLLVGGAVGDRIGARAVMILGDGVLAASTTVVFVVVVVLGSPLWLLVLTALVEGVVTAFYLPASGSMPRRLVGAAVLPRALAVRQAGSQVADLVGGPLGGVLVAAAGFAAAAGVNAVSFTVVLVVLVLIRPVPPERTAPERTVRRSVLAEAGDGVRIVAAHPVVRSALLLTGYLAGLAIPIGSVLVPVLVRDRGWEPTTGGLMLGAQSLGAIVVALVLARTGVARRSGAAAIGSLAVIACGLALLGSVPVAGQAVAAAALFGAGIAGFTGHTGPLILGGSPDSHLSRVQAVLSVVQSGVLVLTTPLLGVGASRFGAPAVVVTCGALLAAGALAATASGSFRSARGAT